MMKNFILAGVTILSLMACSVEKGEEPFSAGRMLPTPAEPSNIPVPKVSETDDFTRDDFNPKFAAWVGLELGMDSDEVEKIARERFGETIIGEGGMTVSYDHIYQTRGRTILIVTQEGALDDAVNGQQLYAEFIPDSPMTNKLEYFGLRQKCQRGKNKGEWTTELCP